MTFTLRDRANETVRSVLPPSATIISLWPDSCSRATRVAVICASSFNVGTMMLISIQRLSKAEFSASQAQVAGALAGLQHKAAASWSRSSGVSTSKSGSSSCIENPRSARRRFVASAASAVLQGRSESSPGGQDFRARR